MGAISMNLHCDLLPRGADAQRQVSRRRWAPATHTRKYWDDYRAGSVSEAEMIEIEGISTRSPGTCNTMGTASTMTSLVDALGLTLLRGLQQDIRKMDLLPPAHGVGLRRADRRDGLGRSETCRMYLTGAPSLNALHTDAALGGSTQCLQSICSPSPAAHGPDRSSRTSTERRRRRRCWLEYLCRPLSMDGGFLLRRRLRWA